MLSFVVCFDNLIKSASDYAPSELRLGVEALLMGEMYEFLKNIPDEDKTTAKVLLSSFILKTLND